MIDWREVPWTLWLLAVLFVVVTVRVELLPEIHDRERVFAVLFMLGWIYLLFRGFRGVWIATTTLFGIAIVIELASGPSPDAYNLSSGIVEIVLLLLPVTRRFFAKERVLTRT